MCVLMKQVIETAWFFRPALAIAIAISLWGCSGNSTLPPIYVGHVAATTGPDRHADEQAARGIRLAVQEQVKEAEKNQLRPIHVRHTDTRGNLQAYEGEAIRLVTVNRVVALLGGATPAEVVRLDKAQSPVIAPCGFRSRDMSEWAFLTGLAPAFQGAALARFAAQELKVASVFVAADERREEFLAAAESFISWLAKSKEKTTGSPGRLSRFGKDRSPQDLAKLLNTDRQQAIAFFGTPSDFAALLRSLSPRPAVVLFAGDDTGPRALTEAPETGSIYLPTAYAVGLDQPRAKEFAAAFAQAYSEEPDVNAALAYDDAQMLFEAIRHCKELTREQIAKELGQLKDFPGLTGPLSFEADRTLRRPAFIARLEKGLSQMVKRYEATDLVPKSEKQ